MKHQIGDADTGQDQILIDLGKTEVLDNVDFGPKISVLRVVSTHPLTLRNPD